MLIHASITPLLPDRIMKNRSVAEGMIIGLRLATLTGGEKADHRKEENGRLVSRGLLSGVMRNFECWNRTQGERISNDNSKKTRCVPDFGVDVCIGRGVGRIDAATKQSKICGGGYRFFSRRLLLDSSDCFSEHFPPADLQPQFRRSEKAAVLHIE